MAITNILMLMKSRESYYNFLSRLFEKEVSESMIKQLAQMNFNSDEVDQPQMKAGYDQLKEYFTLRDLSGVKDDLDADFAHVFLGAGQTKNEAAFPYESVYTSKQRLVMQEAWEQVTGIYADRGLGLETEMSDIKEDHIAMELKYMAYLCAQYGKENAEALLKEQKQFLADHLLNWVEFFNRDIDRYAFTTFYKGIGNLLVGFVKSDAELVDEILNDNDEQETVSYSMSNAQMDQLIAKLSERYHVYAPKALKGRGYEGKDLVRYKEISSVSEIVYDRQTDFSAKEIYYPITQTMLYFTDTEVKESEYTDPKGFLIFLRPCDINAMRRLDNMYLKNGAGPDLYYERLRKKVKIVMMECTGTYDNCFCVSMKSNVADNYSFAVKFEEEGVKVLLKDDMFLQDFAGMETCDYTPSFVTENNHTVTPPVIEDTQTLKMAGSLEYWNKYDDKCIGCGGCNTVCPTCSCFDTVDIIYNETSKDGERRRVWSSCMLDTFTMTAGGGRARKTPGANMRFKSLHKMYDYQKRWKEGENMCVGCGRCVMRCSQNINFIDTINGFHDALEAAKAEAKKGGN